MSFYIDSHVNLHAPQFDEDRADVIDRALDAGVRLLINICDRLSNAGTVLKIAHDHPDIYATIGTHPHEAKEDPFLSPEKLIEAAALSLKIVGIGECGLDYHYDLSPRSVQRSVFQAQIEAAHQLALPLVIHTREADDDMMAMLKDAYLQDPNRKCLLHCYTSGQALAEMASELGAWFSVSGIATFKAASSVREIIRIMPEDRIIVETDCPYLAPIPMRGRRNEPAFVRFVYDSLAQIRGWNLEETIALTDKAFFTLFDRIPVQ